MSSLNLAIIVGRLGSEPDFKNIEADRCVANFSVATSETWTNDNGKQEKTEWHRIVVWGKLAEMCKQHLKKGSLVCVRGKITTRSWEDKQGNKKYTTEVVAESVQFL